MGSLGKYLEQMEKVLKNSGKNADELVASKQNMKCISTLRNVLEHTEIDLTHLQNSNSGNYNTAKKTLCKSIGVGPLSVLLVQWIIVHKPRIFTFVWSTNGCYYCKEYFKWRKGQGLK